MLGGRLPAIKPLWLLWLQPVKVCIKTENVNRPRLFSLSPKSFRNCPNWSVMQRVLGRLAPSRYIVPLFIFLSLSIPFYFLLFLLIFLFSFIIS
ncbi:hypothetical protein FOXYSP1_18894 [Fusarium oxysporum f. sp. phaseoli]